MGKQKISTMADSGRKSGRAVFDNQGRASWEWQTATGVFQTDVTNEQLQGLEASGLELVESEPDDGIRPGVEQCEEHQHHAPHERCYARSRSDSAQAHPAPAVGLIGCRSGFSPTEESG